MTIEPTVELLDGRVVLRAVYEIVLDVIGSGHTIVIEGDGEAVRVEPPVPDDVFAILDSNWRDVDAVLGNAGTPLEQ